MMKTVCTITLLLALVTFTKAQNVNDVAVSDIGATYIEVKGTQKVLAPKVIDLSFDFGSDNASLNGEPSFTDDKGKKVTLSSFVDVCNYFNTGGYNLHTSYGVSTGTKNFYYYIFKKQ